MLYKNCSRTKKVFHGVEFLPDGVAEVSDYINDPLMIRVDERPTEQQPKKLNTKQQKKPAESKELKSAPAENKESEPAVDPTFTEGLEEGSEQ